jgi:hypothetical protein
MSPRQFRLRRLRHTIKVRIAFFERLPGLWALLDRTAAHPHPTPSRRGQLEPWFRSVAPLTDAAYVLWGFKHRVETGLSGPAAAV